MRDRLSTTELAFLALGLVFGVAAGAALLEVVRSRHPRAREIRLTVIPDSIPRRPAATLAGASRPGEPAHGSPDDAAAGPEPIGIAIHSEPDPALEALREIAASLAVQHSALALPPTVHAAHASRTAEGGSAGASPGSAPAPTGGGISTISPSAEATGETGLPAGDHSPGGVQGDTCEHLRRIADERCALALMARSQATAADGVLRVAQREYDERADTAERAAAAAAPRSMRMQKDAAQLAFRQARAAARTPEAVEAAARDWLTEINRINVEAREAARSATRERDAAAALGVRIERLTVEADAARISAESAEATCAAAREALAECVEQAAAVPAGAPDGAEVDRGSPSAGTPVSRFLEGLAAQEPDEHGALALAMSQGEPVIVRLLRGDRATLTAVVERLGGESAIDRRRWQMVLSDLVDAIVGRAIESSVLDFPASHPFWGLYSGQEARDIVAALSSLGYRFDGVGGWLDDRMPSQRDLSLAIGYAGQDPMRLRIWPNEAEMTQLFEGVTVAAAEYLAGTAGGLTLGELLTLLGRRADGLTDLWNTWGTVRPMLLATQQQPAAGSE
jgi:hypothetical protein